jgi:hypothetical protein
MARRESAALIVKFTTLTSFEMRDANPSVAVVAHITVSCQQASLPKRGAYTPTPIALPRSVRAH